MRSNRKLNKYPYIFLGIIHVSMLIYTCYKKKNDRRKLVVLLFSYTGFAYIFEYLVVALFKAYVYKPKFLKQKELDNIFGAICSQFFYVPTTAMFITAFGLGWKIKLIFSFYFVIIEKVFIQLGIFKHIWWKTHYTFFIVFVSFLFNDKWYKELKKGNHFVLFFSFFNMIQVTWMNTVFLFCVLRTVRYGVGWFKSWKEHFRVAPIFGFLFSFLLTWWLKDGNWNSKIKLFLMMLVIDVVSINKRILEIKTYFILPTAYLFIIGTADYYRQLVYGLKTGKPHDD